MAYIIRFDNNPEKTITYLSIDAIKGEKYRATRVANKDLATRFQRTPYTYRKDGDVVELEGAFYYYKDSDPGLYLDFKKVGTNDILFLNRSLLPVQDGAIYAWKDTEHKLGGVRRPNPETILHWVSCAHPSYEEDNNEHNRLRCGLGTNEFTMKVTIEGIYADQHVDEKESV